MSPLSLTVIDPLGFVSAPVACEEAPAATEKVKRLANCAGLQTPLVNKEVHETLSAVQKKADYKLQMTRRATIAAATEVTKAVDCFVEFQNKVNRTKELEQPIKAAIGALSMLGYATKSISQLRREAIRANIKLPSEVKCTCS